MPKAATDVLRSILHAAVIDAIEALRASSKGLPNTMLRDLQSIHRNTAYEDLPKEVQDSIASQVRAAFNELSKEGYAVGPKGEVQSRPPMDRVPERDRRGPPQDRRFVRKGPGRRGPGDRGPGGGRTGPGGGPRPGGNGPKGGGGKGGPQG